MAGVPAVVQPDPSVVAGLAREAGVIAVDTEFVSERRYQSLLCLVQVSVPVDGRIEDPHIEIFDPLAPLEPGPLAEVLADPAIEVLMHAGRQDVALLKRTWRTEVRGVFDTQIAAGFAGYGNQIGYADLVQSLTKRRPKRSEGFTRWDGRPLSDDQIEYARADVEHLPQIAAELKARLEQAGRLEWALEECRALEEASDERDADTAYRSLPRLGRLTGAQRAVAYELASWRDDTAREWDRPPSTVLPDHVLLEVARRAPKDREGLSQVRGMPERTLGRGWRDLVAAIERGTRAEPLPWEEERRPDLDRADAPLVALAQALVRQRTLEAEIAVELVATQSEIQRIVASARRGGESDGRTLRGWRRELVGQELLDLLEGRLVLSAAPRGVRVERVSD